MAIYESLHTLSTAVLMSSLVAIWAPRWWPAKFLAFLGVTSSGCAVCEPVAVSCGGDDVGVVAEPVEE